MAVVAFAPDNRLITTDFAPRHQAESENRRAGMGTPRSIEVLLSVFDLHVTETSERNEHISTRVIFTFDRKRGTREFTLLNSELPSVLCARIEEWLNRNVDEEKIAYGIKSNRIYLRPYRDSFHETQN
jgi:hypothetical protein